MASQKDPYFIPTGKKGPIVITESIEDSQPEESSDFQFISTSSPNTGSLKLIFYTVLSLVGVMFVWQIYSTFVEINTESTVLAIIFSFVVIVLLALVLQQVIIFRRGILGFKKSEQLRDQAEMFIKERTHGQSTKFIEELKQIYSNKPQEKYLEKALSELPDYLNDAEIITRLSDDFFSQLDEEAKRLVIQESSTTAGMIAISQLVVFDSVIVTWRTMKMVNGISSIYGLSLTKLGQWNLFVRTTKAILLSGGSQMAINSVADTAFKAHTFIGPMAANLTQGLGVGAYVAKIGVEAMKQSRPVTFDESQLPSVNLITDGIRLVLNKTFQSAK
ncbi:MAG: DUF697 domain-containing protein [Cycloclasticus sp.]|nr:DUF697 domain-containing protein [Cycloclasticus sp.]